MSGPLILLAFPAVVWAAGPGPGPAIPAAAAPSPVSAVVLHASTSVEELYRGGQTWGSFFEAVEARRALWVRTWTQARVPEELAARARAAGGPWRVLVITEPGCSDSANAIPYIAKLVEETPGLELRLVNSTVGRPWLEAHRSPDDRAATPLVLVLDEAYEIRGCWIEQPVELQAIWLPIVARGTMAEEVDQKMTWYAEDEGRETLREFVEVLEGARSGQVICPGLG